MFVCCLFKLYFIGGRYIIMSNTSIAHTNIVHIVWSIYHTFEHPRLLNCIIMLIRCFFNHVRFLETASGQRLYKNSVDYYSLVFSFLFFSILLLFSFLIKNTSYWWNKNIWGAKNRLVERCTKQSDWNKRNAVVGSMAHICVRCVQ